ncbi:MAG TPA: ABC transporter ATP-binding protein [Thermoanaerobaculaceae bacterium]|nr:ABC transporter ATP-binding protein [Thermoanaerobaculaceae bacterium]HPS77468.1 ABC transporter ATP-binding protein [Thermoanaerobaculaceae bacterium]
MTAHPIFDAHGLAKRYTLGQTKVEALRGVDLQVRAGEVLVVAGPSGSGKSTLLHLLGTLDEPDSGSLELDGTAVATMNEGARTLFRRVRLGFVFQTFNLLPVMSARENVELPLWLAGVGGRERRARAEAVLAEVGLERRFDHRPDQLSGGERQRVAIARAIVHRPLAVLADEPTGNLDSETATGVMDLLTALNRSGGTAFVVATHDPSLIARAPRLVSLHDGRVAADSGGGVA